MIIKVDPNEIYENNLRKHSDNLSKAAKELNRCYPQDDSYQESMLHTIFSAYCLVLSQFGDTMAAQEVFDSLKKLAEGRPIKPIEDLPEKWLGFIKRPSAFKYLVVSVNESEPGTLYILKETNMRKMIQKGETMPVVSDIRADFLSGKSPSGRVEYLDYLTSMQKILWEEKHPGEECRLPGKKLREKAAVLYINKRGGKGAADEISMDYGQYYIEFIKKQIRLLNPKTVASNNNAAR